MKSNKQEMKKWKKKARHAGRNSIKTKGRWMRCEYNADIYDICVYVCVYRKEIYINIYRRSAANELN